MRQPVELKHAYRLLNHGPTTLITSKHGDQKNVMAAAWVVPVDFEPPKLAAIISADSYSRELIDASREFCINLPDVQMLDVTYAVGSVSGRDQDKFATHELATFAASIVKPPLIEGCVGWLECRVLDEPEVAKRYDLILAEVVAAFADSECFAQGRWRSDAPFGRQTLHHVAGPAFFATGALLTAGESAP